MCIKINHVRFLDKLSKRIQYRGIDITGATLDHLAYQTKSSKEYDRIKPEFEMVAKLIKEPLVGGRRVGVFEFRAPLVYKDQTIRAIDLIEPKEEQKCSSGLEHMEYLLPVSLEEFMEKYPNVDWNTGAINRDQFPMLILRLSNNMQVKFPRNPILG